MESLDVSVSLKRRFGVHCPIQNQLHVPLNAEVVRNAVCNHFEKLTCHAEDEVIAMARDTLNHEDSVPVLDCQFSKDGLGGHLLATADEQGCVSLMDTRRRAKNSTVEEFMAHHNAIHEICWNRCGSELVTASADNTLKLWDVSCTCKERSTLLGHGASVKSIDVHRGEPAIMVSGGRDGLVIVWDTRYNNRGTHHSPLHTAHCQSPSRAIRSNFRRHDSSETAPKQTVTAVRFLGEHGVLSAGINGTIKVWDKRSFHRPCHMFEAPKKLGITSLALDTHHTQLYASCKDSTVYAFDCMNYLKHPVGMYGGHTVSSYYIKITLSPDDKYLLSGSTVADFFSPGGVIWEINDREEEDYCAQPMVMLKGQAGEVTGVAWCPRDLSKIVTCSDNHDTWVWRTGNKSDKIIATSEYCGVKGYLRIRPHTPISTTPSPSNCYQETTSTHRQHSPVSNCQPEQKKIITSSLYQTPATSPLYSSCSDNSESRKRRVPLDTVTNTLHTPKRTVCFKKTKQLTLNELLSSKRKNHDT